MGAQVKGTSILPGTVQAPVGRDPWALFLLPRTEGVALHGLRLSYSVAVGSDFASSRACAQGEPGLTVTTELAPALCPPPGSSTPGLVFVKQRFS